jgi:hypothetical protein
MKHDLESSAMRLLRDFQGVLVIGQDGNGEGIAESEDGFGCAAVAAEIVDNDGELRICYFSSGIPRFYTGCGRRARHDFDFEHLRAGMPELEVQ